MTERWWGEAAHRVVPAQLRSTWARARARGGYSLRRAARRPLRTPTADRFADLADAEAMLERILVDNVIPFWSGVVDDEHGGFRLHHDLAGRWCGPAPRHLVTQARTTWYFARLHRSPWGTADDLRAARHGAAFLRDAHRDERHGGYHWLVDHTGRRPIERTKVVYGQAFVVFALSELAAAGDAEAAASATELVALLEQHAHDPDHGGYVEFLDEDWSTPAAARRSPREGTPAGWKTRDTHLHLLEALLEFDRAVGGEGVADRLRELVTALTVSLRSPISGAVVERRTRQWGEPGAGRHDEAVSYGHDLEGVWLLDDTVRHLGDVPALLLPHHLAVFDQAVRYGIDHRRGGVAWSGYPGVRAGFRQRAWWVQAEALVACLAMARLTGEGRYLDVFASTLAWIVDHQVDWERGEWFEWVSPDGRPRGVKAGPWKGPYHSARAMLESLELIRQLRR